MGGSWTESVSCISSGSCLCSVSLTISSDLNYKYSAPSPIALSRVLLVVLRVILFLLAQSGVQGYSLNKCYKSNKEISSVSASLASDTAAERQMMRKAVQISPAFAAHGSGGLLHLLSYWILNVSPHKCSSTGPLSLSLFFFFPNGRLITLHMMYLHKRRYFSAEVFFLNGLSDTLGGGSRFAFQTEACQSAYHRAIRIFLFL